MGPVQALRPGGIAAHVGCVGAIWAIIRGSAIDGSSLLMLIVPSSSCLMPHYIYHRRGIINPDRSLDSSKVIHDVH